MNKTRLLLPAMFFTAAFITGWGFIGHKIINMRSVMSATPEMQFYSGWEDSLASHASDADIRKSWDPDEGARHYIDIDNYPEFLTTGTIQQSFDSLVALYGYAFVLEQGILPWAIIRTVDSVFQAFENSDMHKAMLLTADLGHYIADAHMPLHLTKNYNGQLTGQNGIHSRYESTLININQNLLVYDGAPVDYITNIDDFVFNMIYENYQYVDSVLSADVAAETFAGNHTSTAYYNKLWELTGSYTIDLFRKASYRLVSLVYTKWIDAGSPVSIRLKDNRSFLIDYFLSQNYPNPFNPVTKISYALPGEATVEIKVYNILGQLITTLVNEQKPAGYYEVEFNAADLPSGVYLYRIQAVPGSRQAGDPSTGSGQIYVQTRKMLLLK